MTGQDESGDAVSYHAELDFELTFHSYEALDAAFSEVGAKPPPHVDGEQEDAGWPLVSPWSEFAHATLDGLRLTGFCSGKLHDNYELRVKALASHADGHIDGIGEDVWLWRDRLAAGHVERHLGKRTFPADTTVERLDLDRALQPRGRIQLDIDSGLDRITAIPWIAEHTEEVTHHGRDAGTIALTGVAGLNPHTLTRAAPEAVWQAYCGVQTATPNRWIAHHPDLGTIEGHHIDGQLVIPYPGSPGAPFAGRGSRDVARLAEITGLLDTAKASTADTPAAEPADPLAVTVETPQPGSPDPRPQTQPPRSSR